MSDCLGGMAHKMKDGECVVCGYKEVKTWKKSK